MEERAANMYDEAVQMLKDAGDELYRPKEDVVSFLVCKNSQFAIQNFLRGYLLQHGFETTEEDTIDALFNKCKSINKNFEKVDLQGFDCQAHDLKSRFCEGAEKVSRCFDIADSLDTFLREEKIIS